MRPGSARNGSADFDERSNALHRPDDADELTEESSRARRRAGASPMTSCSPRSSPSPWCAAGCGACRGGRTPATGASSRRSGAPCPSGSPASQEKAVADIRRDLVADKRMLRLLQGDVGSGKTVVALLAMASAIEAGPAGRPDGADRDPGAPAFRAPRAPGREAGLRIALLDRPRQAAPSAGPILAGLADGGIDIAVGTHALFQEGVAFHDLGACRRRRAAPLRRAPAPRARGQGRGGRHPGDDRDADPAHPGADLFRRHGRLGAAREARRPQADRDEARIRSSGWTRSSAPSGAPSPPAIRSTGSARSSANPRPSISPRRRSASSDLRKVFGDAVGLVHGSLPAATRTPPWSASPAARPGSSSRRR